MELISSCLWRQTGPTRLCELERAQKCGKCLFPLRWDQQSTMMKLANYLEIKTPAVFTVAKLIKLDLFHQRPHLRPTYLSRTFFSFKVFIRPIIRFTMKSPWPEQSKQSRKSKKGDKRRTTEFSKYIYKLQKEVSWNICCNAFKVMHQLKILSTLKYRIVIRMWSCLKDKLHAFVSELVLKRPGCRSSISGEPLPRERFSRQWDNSRREKVFIPTVPDTSLAYFSTLNVISVCDVWCFFVLF